MNTYMKMNMNYAAENPESKKKRPSKAQTAL